jgi:hypothetical protein
MEEELLKELKVIIMSTKKIKKVMEAIDDLVNDPNFIRIGELLAEKRRLQQIEDRKTYDNAGNKLKKK